MPVPPDSEFLISARWDRRFRLSSALLVIVLILLIAGVSVSVVVSVSVPISVIRVARALRDQRAVHVDVVHDGKPYTEDILDGGRICTFINENGQTLNFRALALAERTESPE
jgi:hypothetical protein